MSKDAAISTNPQNHSTIRLDLLLLDRLTLIQRFCLTAAIMIAGGTLFAWMCPPLGHLLPKSWMHMKANTCLTILCCILSLILAQPKRGHRMLIVSRIFAGIVGCVAIITLLQIPLHTTFNIGNLLVSNAYLPQPLVGSGIGIPPACYLAALSLVVVLMNIHKRFAGMLADLFVFSIGFLVLVVGAGNLFGASRLSNLAAGVHVSPQTLACLILLTYVVILRKSETGYFAILMGTGIGSKIARIACPFALLLPFLLDMGEDMLVQKGWMSHSYASALASASAALLAFILILILAWRIDTLEKAIHELSLRDELTHVYNRRGFYMLAEQSFYLAQRSRAPFSVLFIDLDGLKHINDTLGHETGSAFLSEVAVLLKKCFRRSDVIGRVGGDEFVVAGESSAISIQHAVDRLKRAAEDWNAQPGRTYRLSFSYGLVTSSLDKEETLEDLLSMADREMYEAKRTRNKSRDSDPVHPIAR
jgi:diguanylate cyclase (GGDEF)-like protein